MDSSREKLTGWQKKNQRTTVTSFNTSAFLACQKVRPVVSLLLYSFQMKQSDVYYGTRMRWAICENILDVSQ